MNRNRNKPTLQICSDWINGKGIMTCLTTNFDVPWKNIISGQTLDDDYYGNRSGNKIISPLVEKFLSEDGIADDKMVRLASVIFSKYGENWDRAWAAITAEYSPLENYNMEEHETPAEYTRESKPASTKTEETPAEYKINETPAGNTTTVTPSDSKTTVTPSDTKQTETQPEYSDTSKIEGFNSNDFVDANKSIHTPIADGETKIEYLNDGETKVEYINDGKTKIVYDNDRVLTYKINKKGESLISVVENGKEVFTVDSERSLTRSGNIGVTTSQQMLMSEFDLRKAYSLMDTIVFPDVDKVMCLNVFGCEETTWDDFTIVTDYVLPVASSSVLGGVKIGDGITIGSDGTISVTLGDYITTEQLTAILNDYVTITSLQQTLANYATTSSLSDYATIASLQQTLANYATTQSLTNGLATKQDTLVSGTNIKTINDNSILGSGNIVIEGGGGNAYKRANAEIVNGYFSFNDATHGWIRDDGSGSKTLKIDISEYAGKFLKSYSITDKVLGVNRMRVAIANHELAIQGADYVAEDGVYVLQSVSSDISFDPLYMYQTFSTSLHKIGDDLIGDLSNSLTVNTYIPDDAKYMYIYYYSQGSEYSLDNVLCTLEII